MRTTLHLVTRARLPRLRRDLPVEPDPRAPAAARRSRRGRRLRRRRRAPGGVDGREAAYATGAPRAARTAEAPDRGPQAVAGLVRALGARRPGQRPGVVGVALPHGGRHVRAGSRVAGRRRRLGRGPSRAAVPRRLRARLAGGRREVDGHGAERRRPWVRGATPAPVPRRERPGARRPPSSSAASAGHARSCSPPAALRQPRAEPRRSASRAGRRASRGRDPGRRGEGDVPRRRVRRRDVVASTVACGSSRSPRSRAGCGESSRRSRGAWRASSVLAAPEPEPAGSRQGANRADVAYA